MTATRNEERTDRAPQPVSVVAREELEARQPASVTELLATVPGVHFRGAGPFRPRPVLRGLDSNRLLVLVDGQRLNNGRTSTTNAGIEPSLVDPAQVERVEIVRGASSVLHGSDALAGVVNIVTRDVARPSEPTAGGSLTAEGHSVRDGWRLSARGEVATPRWALSVAGARGAFDDYRSPEGPVPGSAARESNLESTLRLWPSDGSSLRLQWTRRRGREIGVPGLGPDGPFFASFPFDDRDKAAAFFRRREAGPLEGLQGSFYWQKQTRNFFNRLATPGFSLSSSTVTDTRSLGLDVQATQRAGAKHRLTFGASFFRDANEDERRQVAFAGTPRERLLATAPSVPRSRMADLGLFVQDEWAATERLVVNLGLRGDLFDVRAETTPGFEGAIPPPRRDATLNGAAGVVFGLGDELSVFGRIARAFREPNLFERFFFGRGSVGGFVVPNPELEPETAVGVDAGLRWSSPRVRTEIVYFRNRLRDLIATVPGTYEGSPTFGGQPVFTAANVERARLEGLELTAEVSWSAGRLWWQAYTRHSLLRGTNETTGAPLPLVAPFLSRSGLRTYAAGGRWVQEIELETAAGSDRVPEESPPLEGFAMLHLRGQIGLAEPGGLLSRAAALPDRVYWSIENVTNDAHRLLFGTVPAEGRNLKIYLRWGF